MSSSARIELDTTVVATEEQVSSTLDGEEVILDLSSGTYYGLNHVGRRVWLLIQSPRSVRSVCDHMVEEFDVSRERVEKDVLALLNEMRAEDLIQVNDAARPAP